MSLSSLQLLIDNTQDPTEDEDNTTSLGPPSKKIRRPSSVAGVADPSEKEPTPVAPRFTTNKTIVKQGNAEMAVCQTSESCWVGELDSQYLPHGEGVLFLRFPDGKVRKRVEERTHGILGGKPWNMVLPPPRSTRQRTGRTLCSTVIHGSSHNEEEEDDLDCDRLPESYDLIFDPGAE